ncbi:MAG: sigma-54 factor interaction domain-containing protein, partial [Acidobacteria bacterium]|nr:sigma-54 factor interaction domain-containing protein [Acidobacteriota bacterium]
MKGNAASKCTSCDTDSAMKTQSHEDRKNGLAGYNQPAPFVERRQSAFPGYDRRQAHRGSSPTFLEPWSLLAAGSDPLTASSTQVCQAANEGFSSEHGRDRRERSCDEQTTHVPHRRACMLVELGNDRFFLAASQAMRDIHSKICRIAPVNVPVLITGESGVGKEVVANLLHRQSNRANRQFLKINCAALPKDLLESELFGYEAGAFTGAMKSKPGKFEQCANGTMLLDEIGEMCPTLQAKLLQVLQDGEFCRL